MRIAGERVPRKSFIQTEQYLVVVDTEMVISPDDPGQPVYETETLDLIWDVKQHALCGDVKWLKQRGKVYVALEL